MKSMKYALSIVLGFAVFASLVATPAGATGRASDDRQERSYEITFTNLSGQPMTPPVLAVHNKTADIFEVGEGAIEPVREIAENGNITPLVELASGLSDVTAAAVAGAGPLFTGESVTVTVDTDRSWRRLSVVSMVVCTNDGFTGLDSVRIPWFVGDSATFYGQAYDAGTEQNIEDPDYWVPPCGGNGENLKQAESGVITMHPGLSGFGDLDFESGQNMLKVDVTRVERDVPAPTPEPEPEPTPGPARVYELTFTNHSGQPMTPPVVAIHNKRADIFEVGEGAIDEVREIAENGNITPLVELASGARNVAAAAVAGDGPLLPGESVTITVDSDETWRRLSVVAMVVCTNDGFTGFDSVRIPWNLGDSAEFAAVAYDAGTEQNILDPDYWVPPCGGNGENLKQAESGVITKHPGQSGFGAMDFAEGDELLTLSVTRVG